MCNIQRAKLTLWKVATKNCIQHSYLIPMTLLWAGTFKYVSHLSFAEFILNDSYVLHWIVFVFIHHYHRRMLFRIVALMLTSYYLFIYTYYIYMYIFFAVTAWVLFNTKIKKLISFAQKWIVDPMSCNSFWSC